MADQGVMFLYFDGGKKGFMKPFYGMMHRFTQAWLSDQPRDLNFQPDMAPVY